MNKFKQNQTFYVKLQTKKFVNPIPIVYCVPEIIDRNTVVYIFNCGLGSTNAWNLYMNCPLFQRNYFVIYEKQGHGLNHNKPSQYLKKYIYELDVIIQWTKKFFPQYQIFLLGESWGGSINCLYYKKYHHYLCFSLEMIMIFLNFAKQRVIISYFVGIKVPFFGHELTKHFVIIYLE